MLVWLPAIVAAVLLATAVVLAWRKGSLNDRIGWLIGAAGIAAAVSLAAFAVQPQATMAPVPTATAASTPDDAPAPQLPDKPDADAKSAPIAASPDEEANLQWQKKKEALQSEINEIGGGLTAVDAARFWPPIGTKLEEIDLRFDALDPIRASLHQAREDLLRHATEDSDPQLDPLRQDAAKKLHALSDRLGRVPLDPITTPPGGDVPYVEIRKTLDDVKAVSTQAFDALRLLEAKLKRMVQSHG